MTTTATRTELLADLVAVQNDASNWNRDIVSISALMSDAELARHVRKEANNLSARAYTPYTEPSWLEYIRLFFQTGIRFGEAA